MSLRLIIILKSKQYLEDVNAELFVASTRLRQAYNDAIADLHAMEVAGDSILGETTNRTYKSISGHINPEVLPLLDSSATLANLDINEAGRRDIQNLVDLIRQRQLDLIGSRMLGVTSLVRPSTTDMGVRWSTIASVCCISSRSQEFRATLNSVGERENMKQHIQSLLHHDSGEDTSTVVLDTARPWDCSLTFMMIGNYLENITGFAFGGAGFCRTVYERSKDNILHHVLLLDKGQYLTREFINDEEALRLAISEKTGAVLRERILEQYSVHPIQEALS